MSITTIARQAQGIRTGEVIAKLAKDAYFMWVKVFYELSFARRCTVVPLLSGLRLQLELEQLLLCRPP
jgi:hypothetical protein